MNWKTLLYAAGFAALTSGMAAGCGNSGEDDGKGGSSSDGTGADGAGAQGGAGLGVGASSSGGSGTIITEPTEECSTAGTQCSAGGECCSGLCNELTGECAQALGTCNQAGIPCGDATECCSLNCQSDVCQEDQCVADAQDCSNDDECCSGDCKDDGTCADLNGDIACKTSGNPCDGNGDCCSGLCNDNGTCSLGSSYCIQLDDVCTGDEQCCQGTCAMAEGATRGTCQKQMTGGTGCDSKKLAGEVCDGSCADCCSRACAPYGPSGATICQAPSGCKPAGELCKDDLDCCGGDPESGLAGAGNAKCEGINEQGIGRCKSTSCVPQGSICKYDSADYTEFCGATNSTSPNACCAGTGADSIAQHCRLDSLNIPRCNALGECRDEGETCSSTDDCCNGNPCVQDPESGTFVCYDDGDDDCVPSTGPCTTNGDCCVGSMCILEPGESTGTCGNSDPPPDDGSGGTGSGGSTSTDDPCAEYGQDCTDAGDCCNDVPCTSGSCIYLVK